MIFEKFIGELKSFKPMAIVNNLGLILTKFVKVAVILRLVKGFVILLGLLTLLKWLGFDFSHVLEFFGSLPELFNMNETWLGDVYNIIFKKVLEFVNGVADNAPEPPNGQKILDAIKKVILRSDNI